MLLPPPLQRRWQWRRLRRAAVDGRAAGGGGDGGEGGGGKEGEGGGEEAHRPPADPSVGEGGEGGERVANVQAGGVDGIGAAARVLGECLADQRVGGGGAECLRDAEHRTRGEQLRVGAGAALQRRRAGPEGRGGHKDGRTRKDVARGAGGERGDGVEGGEGVRGEQPVLHLVKLERHVHELVRTAAAAKADEAGGKRAAPLVGDVDEDERTEQQPRPTRRARLGLCRRPRRAEERRRRAAAAL
mmetsp:Transcript_34982/g.104487  ORF Transcript_34982/g.104487 Transcript_34982/m.104487 type:complete len:244 (-) Transcript_34982:62-793(-)